MANLTLPRGQRTSQRSSQSPISTTATGRRTTARRFSARYRSSGPVLLLLVADFLELGAFLDISEQAAATGWYGR